MYRRRLYGGELRFNFAEMEVGIGQKSFAIGPPYRTRRPRSTAEAERRNTTSPFSTTKVAPRYPSKAYVEGETRYTRVFLGEHGELVKSDRGDRWKKVDPSGTEIRAGSTRLHDIPANAYAMLRKSEKSTGGASSSSTGAVAKD